MSERNIASELVTKRWLEMVEGPGYELYMKIPDTKIFDTRKSLKANEEVDMTMLPDAPGIVNIVNYLRAVEVFLAQK